MDPIITIITKTFYPLAGVLALARGPVQAIGFGAMLLTVDGLKRFFKERRPDRTDRRSFPSGHSACAWYLAAAWGWNVVIVAWAILVAISRVVLRRHFVHDVLAGAVLGISFVLAINRLVPEKWRGGWVSYQKMKEPQ